MTDISLIICTRNRVASLAASLGSIVAAEPIAGVEVIVVDDGSTDGTSAMVADFVVRAPAPVRLLQDGGGLSSARNRGILAAQGRIIAFIDDDCRIAPNFFGILRGHFNADTEPVLRGGRVELGDPTDLPFTIRTEKQPETYRGDRHPGGFVPGCNMSMHRDVPARIGLFDVNFGAGGPCRSAEDTEFAYRAFLHGIPVLYTPDLAVFHYHGRKKVEDIRQLNRGYAEGNGAMYLKYVLDWNLLRHFTYDVRAAVREVRGGPPMVPEYGFTWRDNVLGSMRGMARYVGVWLRNFAKAGHRKVRRRESAAPGAHLLRDGGGNR